MIDSIELENIRIFSDRLWEFKLAPLTVFCGTNSAGKSTVLKSLLLLRQSLSSQPDTAPRLRTVGPHVDFGDYDCLVSNGDIERTTMIGVQIGFAVERSWLEFLRGLADKTTGATRTPGPAYHVCAMRSRFQFEAEAETVQVSLPFDEESRIIQRSNRSHPARLSAACYEVTENGLSLLTWGIRRLGTAEQERSEGMLLTGAPYEITMPAAYFEGLSGPEFMQVSMAEGIVHQPAVLSGLIPQSIVARPAADRPGGGVHRKRTAPTEEWSAWPLPPPISTGLSSLERSLKEIVYLGPLRSPAKRFYIAHNEPELSVDAAGETTPYILRDRGNAQVHDWFPGSTEVVTSTLTEAINRWLHYFRTGEPKRAAFGEVSIDTTKEVLVQISLVGLTGRGSYALADSGFGYSQVLPIILRGLLAAPGSTFVVEQPELHLNPSLQVRLADFFVAMVRSGKQVLIETHSEHIVNAIRVLAAEDESGTIAERSRIYFLDATNGRATVRDMSIQRDGMVPRWPKEFFGEALSLTGRLLRAQRRFRKPMPERSGSR